jgi:hypothetical protein
MSLVTSNGLNDLFIILASWNTEEYLRTESQYTPFVSIALTITKSTSYTHFIEGLDKGLTIVSSERSSDDPLLKKIQLLKELSLKAEKNPSYLNPIPAESFPLRDSKAAQAFYKPEKLLSDFLESWDGLPTLETESSVIKVAEMVLFFVEPQTTDNLLATLLLMEEMSLPDSVRSKIEPLRTMILLYSL